MVAPEVAIDLAGLWKFKWLTVDGAAPLAACGI